jgi:hypothetical protein
MTKRESITQEYLKTILHYDPETGIWRWRKGRNNSTKKPNASGHVGIDRHAHGKWRARFGRGKKGDLGLFDKLEDAIAARQKAIDARDIGKIAGTISEGYVVIWIEGRFYRAHRLAHFYMTGEWPPADIDHKRRDRTDNRWEEIRPATRSQNFCNAKIRKNNTSGCKGVSWHKASQKWRARVILNHATTTKLFTKFEDAVAWRKAVAEELHGEFVRHD